MSWARAFRSHNILVVSTMYSTSFWSIHEFSYSRANEQTRAQLFLHWQISRKLCLFRLITTSLWQIMLTQARSLYGKVVSSSYMKLCHEYRYYKTTSRRPRIKEETPKFTSGQVQLKCDICFYSIIFDTRVVQYPRSSMPLHLLRMGKCLVSFAIVQWSVFQ